MWASAVILIQIHYAIRRSERLFFAKLCMDCLPSIIASISRRELIMMDWVTEGFSQLMSSTFKETSQNVASNAVLDYEDKQLSHKILF